MKFWFNILKMTIKYIWKNTYIPQKERKHHKTKIVS